MSQIKHNRYIYFTLKQLFLQGVHLGAQLSKTHTNMKRYLLPKTGDISFSIINLQYSVIYFRLSFNLIQNIISKRGVLLVVNENKLLISTLKESWKHLNQPISFGEWSSGTLTNFRFILRKTLKTFFVKSRLAQKIKRLERSNGKLSLKLNNKTRSKFNLKIFLSELRRRIRKLYTLPHVLFVTDTMLSSVVVNEANIVKIPLIGIVDSTNNVLEVSYPIPGNSNSIKTLLFYYKLIKLVVLKGMLLEKANFLRILSRKLNFELKTYQLIKTSKSKKRYPFKNVSPSVIDNFFFKKDLSDFFTNSKFYYLFYPNFKEEFYSKLPMFLTFIRWQLFISNRKLIIFNKHFFYKSLTFLLLNKPFFLDKKLSKKLKEQQASYKELKLNNTFSSFYSRINNINSSTFIEKYLNDSVIQKIPSSIVFLDILKEYSSSILNTILFQNIYFSALIKKNTLFKKVYFCKSFNNKFFTYKESTVFSNKIVIPTDYSNKVVSRMLNYSFISKFSRSTLYMYNKFFFNNFYFKLFFTYDIMLPYSGLNSFICYNKLNLLYSKRKINILLNNVSAVTDYLLICKRLHNQFFNISNVIFKKELSLSVEELLKVKHYFKASIANNSLSNQHYLAIWQAAVSNLVSNYKLFYSFRTMSVFNWFDFKLDKTILSFKPKKGFFPLNFKFVNNLKQYQNNISDIKPLNLLAKGHYNPPVNQKFYKDVKSKDTEFLLSNIIKDTLRVQETKKEINLVFNKKHNNENSLNVFFSSFLEEVNTTSSIFYKLYGKII